MSIFVKKKPLAPSRASSSVPRPWMTDVYSYIIIIIIIIIIIFSWLTHFYLSRRQYMFGYHGLKFNSKL
jgi:hypothetical protein